MKLLHIVFKWVVAGLFTLMPVFPLLSPAFVLPGDNDYFILKEKQYHIIFDKQYLSSIDTINQKIKAQMESMSQFKNRTLDESLTIVLLSSKAQISNAVATVYPSPTIIMYPVGTKGLELSLPFWFDSIFEHELNHVFQMSHSKTSKTLKKFFNFPSLLFFYLYNPYPNVFLPRFVLEGDSILKESLFHYGGRLYNGYARAFVYSQIKHFQHQIDQWTTKNLLTFRLTPHSRTEKYLHGGYFMAMLAEAYPHETLNSFFKVDKKNPSRKIRKQIKESSVKELLSPFFAEHFSFRYIRVFLKKLTKTYFNHWLKEASKQKSSAEPAIFESAICPDFGSSENEIFFLTFDRKSTPMLRIFNKKTKKWTSQKRDLPLGKAFKIKGKFYARSSKEIKPNIVHYSLFSEGLRNNKNFDSKYAQDLWNNKILYIDSKNNLDGFKLYVNDSFYADISSNALFDKKGNIYFFKQKNETRTLYKNKKPVFSYAGYYGSLLDIEADGTIYFTGSSPYGSSVYQYKNGKILRSLSSDTVIQAKKINNKEFIACEITPYGYEYKIIPKRISREKPVLYKYKFKKRKPIQIGKNEIQASDKQIPPDSHIPSLSEKSNLKEKTSALNPKRQISSTEKKKVESKKSSLEYNDYFPLKYLRYKGGSAMGLIGGLNIFGANLLFSDYLLQNNISLSYFTAFPYYHLKDGFHLFNFKYHNHIYPLEWNLGYQMIAYFDRDENETEDGTIEPLNSINMEHIGYLHLKYPVFKKGRWFSSVSSLKHLSLDKSEYSGIKSSWRGQINLGYSQSFPYNYAPNKYSVLSLFFDNQYYLDPKKNGVKAGAIWDSTFHLINEFYVFPSLSYAHSFNSEVNPAQAALYKRASFKEPDYQNASAFFHSSDPFSSFEQDIGNSNFMISNIFEPFFKNWYKAKGIGTASLGLKKAFHLSLGGWESRFIPLGQVRWIIFKNFLGHDTKRVGYNTVDFQYKSLSKNIPIDEVKKITEMAEEKAKENVKEIPEYIQWLEWTVGFESETVTLSQVPLILGFAMGLRTPVRFWDETSLEPEKESKTWAYDDDIGISNSNKITNVFFTNFYLKMPF